jgi:hypothetical protein
MAGCGPGDPAESVTVSDSAGVRIVESGAPSWRVEREWRLENNAVLRIGSIDRPEDQLLHAVTTALGLAGGGFVIANAGAELRFYDAGGEFVRAVGRRGRGPGEFATISSVHRLRDSLVVFDRSLLRYTILGMSGEPGRTVNLPAPGRYTPISIGPTSPAAMVLRMRPVSAPSTVGGRRRRDDIIVRFTLDPPVVDTVGVFPGAEDLTIATGSISGTTAAPFGWSLIGVVRRGDILLAYTEGFHVHVYDARGILRARFGRRFEPAPVTQARIDSFLRVRREAQYSSERGRRVMDAFLETVTFPPTHPVLDAILVDADDNTWVRHATPDTEEQRSWSVFDPDGAWLGTIDTPGGLRITDIGDEYVLGVVTDELGVNFVVKHRLIKP